LNLDNYLPVVIGHDEPVIACPVCGFDYVHPLSVICRSPGTERGEVTIDANGVAIDPHQPPNGRGTRITVSFAGECGHRFQYVLQFHKGQTLVSRSMSDAPNSDFDTIWRN